MAAGPGSSVKARLGAPYVDLTCGFLGCSFFLSFLPVLVSKLIPQARAVASGEREEGERRSRVTKLSATGDRDGKEKQSLLQSGFAAAVRIYIKTNTLYLACRWKSRQREIPRFARN